MKKFFKPSEELAKKLGDYHGQYSLMRLDYTSSHAPARQSPVSVEHVQEAVRERLDRMFGTLARRMSVANSTELRVTEETFTENVFEMVRHKFNFQSEDSRTEELLCELSHEFKAWLIGQDGRYDFSPLLSYALVMRNDMVYLVYIDTGAS